MVHFRKYLWIWIPVTKIHNKLVYKNIALCCLYILGSVSYTSRKCEIMDHVCVFMDKKLMLLSVNLNCSWINHSRPCGLRAEIWIFHNAKFSIIIIKFTCWWFYIHKKDKITMFINVLCIQWANLGLKLDIKFISFFGLTLFSFQNNKQKQFEINWTKNWNLFPIQFKKGINIFFLRY